MKFFQSTYQFFGLVEQDIMTCRNKESWWQLAQQLVTCQSYGRQWVPHLLPTIGFIKGFQ